MNNLLFTTAVSAVECESMLADITDVHYESTFGEVHAEAVYLAGPVAAGWTAGVWFPVRKYSFVFVSAVSRSSLGRCLPEFCPVSGLRNVAGFVSRLRVPECDEFQFHATWRDVSSQPQFCVLPYGNIDWRKTNRSNEDEMHQLKYVNTMIYKGQGYRERQTLGLLSLLIDTFVRR